MIHFICIYYTLTVCIQRHAFRNSVSKLRDLAPILIKLFSPAFLTRDQFEAQNSQFEFINDIHIWYVLVYVNHIAKCQTRLKICFTVKVDLKLG